MSCLNLSSYAIIKDVRVYIALLISSKAELPVKRFFQNLQLCKKISADEFATANEKCCEKFSPKEVYQKSC